MGHAFLRVRGDCMVDFNVAKLRTDLAGNEDFQKGEVWQAVVDLCYNEWQKPDNKDWRYSDLISYARLVYGSFAKLLCLMGSYGGEVCNGGHDQYYCNGYASDKSGTHSDKTHCALTREMMRLMQEFRVDTLGEGPQIYAIMRDFVFEVGRHDPDDFSDREDDDEDDSELDKLDDRYYAINEAWEKTINKLIMDWLENGSNPIPEPVPVQA